VASFAKWWQTASWFVPAGEVTALTLTHEHFADEAARDRHHHGWTGSLDRLAAFVG
jgi:Activator of Hsp90 ATPase homolog 1-like protein